MLTDPGADRHKTDNNKLKIQIMFKFTFLLISFNLVFVLGPKDGNMSVCTAHAKMNECNLFLRSYGTINTNMVILGLLFVRENTSDV